jgi:hypothetical protein
MKNGRVVHDYNFFGLNHTKVASKAPLAPGAHTVVYEFVPDEAKPGTGGKSTLKVNGEVVAEAHIPKTQPFAFSADEGADVGVDNETMVSDDPERANAVAALSERGGSRRRSTRAKRPGRQRLSISASSSFAPYTCSSAVRMYAGCTPIERFMRSSNQ